MTMAPRVDFRTLQERVRVTDEHEDEQQDSIMCLFGGCKMDGRSGWSTMARVLLREMSIRSGVDGGCFMS